MVQGNLSTDVDKEAYRAESKRIFRKEVIYFKWRMQKRSTLGYKVWEAHGVEKSRKNWNSRWKKSLRGDFCEINSIAFM